ncbi:MAG: 2-oxoacid:acceptor oxidoreductase family protein [Deltaproteobacteria bacterium]|nr:2-oxoacid:acceptor oxidoreductase family protein [Deltaproteobacteria bacterium]OQX66313.1 MAG: 2-oxoglutarate ferredoxin oxidoreductase subunit gamma [Desulfococcus sp. 4484_242]
MQTQRIILSGAGGQGVITAAIILAEAAVVYEDLNAVQTQSYGPESRGGATRADVILSDEPIYYPKVEQPNIAVCLTQEAYSRYSWSVRPGGLLLTDTRYVRQDPKVDARQVGFGMHDTVANRIGNPIVFNICVLGVLVGLSGLIRAESIEQVLAGRVPLESLEINRMALQAGLDLARETTW